MKLKEYGNRLYVTAARDDTPGSLIHLYTPHCCRVLRTGARTKRRHQRVYIDKHEFPHLSPTKASRARTLRVAMHVEVLTSKVLRVWSREQDTSRLPPSQSVIICTGPWWPPCADMCERIGGEKRSQMSIAVACAHITHEYLG